VSRLSELVFHAFLDAFFHFSSIPLFFAMTSKKLQKGSSKTAILMKKAATRIES